MKILEIQSCEECFNRKPCGNYWLCGVKDSNIFDSTVIPDWCPLPDRHLTPAAPDSEGRAALENSSIPGDEETFNKGLGW